MKSYIGYSLDPKIRYQSTSGGIGTSLIKYMFDKELIESSISFTFDPATLKYNPILIHSFEEYKMCGSIYQEIDLITFIKSHLNEIKGNFACFALPCQTRAIRTIVEKAGHKTIIIGLTCSSQQTLEATKYLLKQVKIEEKNVLQLQYRGNGWPSGIQIETMDRKQIYITNNNSIWSKIFHSRLFIRPQCFACMDTLNQYSDITLADPWIKRFMQEEKTGKSLIICNLNKNGIEILFACSNDGYIKLESISYDEIKQSQRGTILRKNSYRNKANLIKAYRKLINNKWYRYIALNSITFPIHCKIKDKFEKYLLKQLPPNEIDPI